MLVALAALGACPSFHPDPLPGAPAGATFVDIDGVHVRYRDIGSGPAVVLIHGYGASLDSWASVAPAIAGRHRVIAVDLKGVGWTSRPEGDYSPAAQAQLVWRVLDKLKVTDVAIVGHSWGSSVALAMAVAQPARVRRVALYDAYVYDDQVPGFFRWAQKSGVGEVLFALFYKERIEDRAPLAYFDERWITQPRVERVEEDLEKPGTVAAALATARGHHFAALHEALRGFARPVLLLWGAEDQVTPLRFGQRLANELANATLVVYPRCGHIPMVEAHNQSTRDLAHFLDGEVGPEVIEIDDPAATDKAAAGASSQGHAVKSAIGFIARSGRSRCGVECARVGGWPAGERRRTERPAVLPDRAWATPAWARDQRRPRSARLWPASRSSPRPPAPRSARISPRSARAHAASLRRTARGHRGRPSRRAPRAQRLPLQPRSRSRPRFDRQADLSDSARRRPGPRQLGSARAHRHRDLRAGRRRRGQVAHRLARQRRARRLAGSRRRLARATSGGQLPGYAAVKRVWAEALTPLGVLAVGRMGANFGLGITANGGDCEDCDHGDSADRLAFVSPIAGHLLALAYDIASSGPTTRSADNGRTIGLEPSDKAAGPTIAILTVHPPAALARRAAAGRTSVEYGAYISRRTQDRDVPATYLPTAEPQTTFTSNDLVARGFAATATGGWLRITGARFRIEAEVAYKNASVQNPSLIPGAEITEEVTSSQLGMALESDFDLGLARLGFDSGYASGDSAPGFGVTLNPTSIGESAAPAGSLNGPQANLPGDQTVDKFQFHPDYHIDQILFREIIGTITDAVYLRPHVRTTLLTAGPGRLELGAALIASWAVDATSTPSGARDLGVEIDPELRYVSRDGFSATLDYGLFLPGAAFDNPTAHLEAHPAQVIRARLVFAF